MFVQMIGILDVGLGIRLPRESAVMTAAAATLLIVAYQLIGCLMQLLTQQSGFWDLASLD